MEQQIIRMIVLISDLSVDSLLLVMEVAQDINLEPFA